MIELQHLTKRYGQVLVLDNLSLKVEEGETLALLGPSGCGKTTILRIIAGLEPFESGSVLLRGISASSDPHQRGVSMMFQSPALWPHMTVRQNIAFVSSKANSNDAAALLESLEIADIADRRPHEISGGQARRASLARTLAARSEIILMDEPFAHLGEKLIQQAAAAILDHVRETNATLVVAGHDIQLAQLLRANSVVQSEGNEAMRGEIVAFRGVSFG